MEKRKILIYECIMNILKNIYIARFFLEDNKNYNSGDFSWRVSDL